MFKSSIASSNIYSFQYSNLQVLPLISIAFMFTSSIASCNLYCFQYSRGDWTVYGEITTPRRCSLTYHLSLFSFDLWFMILFVPFVTWFYHVSFDLWHLWFDLCHLRFDLVWEETGTLIKPFIWSKADSLRIHTKLMVQLWRYRRGKV